MTKLSKTKREEIIAAPIVGGVVAVFAYFVLYELAGLSNMSGDLIGVPLGQFISLMMAVIIAAVLFGELLAQAIEKK